MSQVRTRFAPSPTGFLHLGGVRTALFNWLFARRHNGKFILRIDDTDQQRNVQEALEPILEGFRWLDIDWDEGPEVDGPMAPYYQSQRSDRYQTAVQQLLDSGAAYYDFASPEEVQAERDAAQRDGKSFTYSRRWMATNIQDREKFLAEGRQAVVRLKMPREGTLRFTDGVRGPIKFPWSSEQDHVIQRANGTCLYHLASVVDDHDFQISHVIRAEEHLPNTPRQMFIGQSLGFETPTYAHLPYVAEPGSKSKLSKRKLEKYCKNRDFASLNERGQKIAQTTGRDVSLDTFNPVVVDFYRDIGFLPEALVNYLLLLGWSLDDKTEFLSRAAMVQEFSLQRVNKAPASFDPQKLLAFQDHYMQQLPLKKKVAFTLPFLQQAELVETPPPCDTGPRLQQILAGAGQRIQIGGDVLNTTEFFVADGQLRYDEKAVNKRLKKVGAVELLAKFRQVLDQIDSFDTTSTESALREFVEAENIKISDIVHSLRVAVTGKSVGIGMFETMEILGKDSTLARIDQAIKLAD